MCCHPLCSHIAEGAISSSSEGPLTHREVLHNRRAGRCALQCCGEGEPPLLLVHPYAPVFGLCTLTCASQVCTSLTTTARDRLTQYSDSAANRLSLMNTRELYLGAEGDATSGPQRRALTAHPGIASAFLVEGLPAAASNLRPRQRAGCSLMPRSSRSCQVSMRR